MDDMIFAGTYSDHSYKQRINGSVKMYKLMIDCIRDGPQRMNTD